MTDEVVQPVVAATPLRSIQSKAEQASSQARDDVGRWRKIYYRLRRSAGSDYRMRNAVDAVKEAERAAERGDMNSVERTETVRRKLADLSLSRDVDERARVDLIDSARDAASLIRRVDVMGGETQMSFSQLPLAVQDELKRYMKQPNLEERITRHFGPFMRGEVKRSVADILNFVDRIVVDNQSYRKGYDMERV